MKHIVLRLLLALCAFCVFGPRALAQETPASVGSIFHNKGELGLDSVRSDALAQSTATPHYKSNGLETRFYEGYFKPASDNSKLALLSDDGTSVSVDGQSVLSEAGQNQGFEDFDSAFTPLSSNFEAGKIYHLRVEYTNTVHAGDADVDGVSLWAYDGGGSIVSLSLTVAAKSGEICAGGVDNEAHRTLVTATVKDSDNAVVPDIPITFSLVDSHADYKASLKEDSDTTDAQGEAFTTLVSSRKIGASATIIARGANLEARSSSVSMQDADEEVWSFSADELEADGEAQATVKLELKYKGLKVEGHDMDWRIERILNLQGQEVYTADPKTGSREGYGSLEPTSGTTDDDGVIETTYTVGTKGGTIEFAALDDTVVANSPKKRTSKQLTANIYDVYVGTDITTGATVTQLGSRSEMRFYITLYAVIKKPSSSGSPAQTIDFVRKRYENRQPGSSDSGTVRGQLKPNSSTAQFKNWEYWSRAPVINPLPPQPPSSGWEITKLRGKWQISVKYNDSTALGQIPVDFKIDKRNQIVQMARSWKDSESADRTSCGANTGLCGGFTAMVYEELGLRNAAGLQIPSAPDPQHDYMGVNDNRDGAILFYRSNEKALLPGWVTGHAAIRDGSNRINNNSNTKPGYTTYIEPMSAGVNPNGSSTDYFDIHSRSSVDLDGD